MRFSDEKTHAKAIYLLEYIATGNESVTGDLGLNALLCGWSPARQLPPAPRLDEVEKQQANRVVDAIRAHWTAPGNMPVDELRHHFLKRNGLLDAGLETRLRVERQPYDTLLSQLPWVYTVTRTPWSETIHVEWGN
jgi:hypothetical protein